MQSLKGKEIWNSAEGGDLMKASLGLKEIDPSNLETIRKLRCLSKTEDRAIVNIAFANQKNEPT